MSECLYGAADRHKTSAPTRIPPTLKTARLRLVAPALRHASGLFAYGSRPDFTTFLDSVPFRVKKDAQQFLRALRTDNRLGKRVYWVAELAEDGRAIGTLGLLFPFASHHRVAEFGYGFSPEMWGKGFFSEAAKAVVIYAFGVLGLHRIQVLTRSSNIRAIRSVEKLGFRREATLVEFYQDGIGERGDATLLALLAHSHTTCASAVGSDEQDRS
jgi:[ribosomal protein S5]-alanine N-acetyltransferase